MSVSTPAIPISRTPAKSPVRKVPPLENGDRLSRDEFERRYEAMPELKKAELIEGIVYMPPPISVGNHASPHADLITWLGVFRSATPGVRVADNGTIRMDAINDPQPDAALFIEPEYGGRVALDAEGYAEGAAELIAEVAASSASYDLHDKLIAYQRNGVQEYIVWSVHDREIVWFVLRDGRYVRLAATRSGRGRAIFKSKVFPGLWLDAAALMRGDLTTVLSVLQQGLQTPQHAAFLARLGKSHSRTRKRST